MPSRAQNSRNFREKLKEDEEKLEAYKRKGTKSTKKD